MSVVLGIVSERLWRMLPVPLAKGSAERGGLHEVRLLFTARTQFFEDFTDHFAVSSLARPTHRVQKGTFE
jgi:hypothetical protein